MFPQDVHASVDVGVEQQTFARLVQASMHTFSAKPVFRSVTIDGNFVQVQATRLARVTLLLADVLNAVQFALVHKFLTEFVMGDVAQVLIVGLADIHLMLLFLVVADYKMGYTFVKAGVNKHFHNLVEIVVDSVVTTVHQTQHSFGVRGLDVLVLRVFRL